MAAMAEAKWHQGTADADLIEGGDGIDWMVYAGSHAAVQVDLSPGGRNTGGIAEGDTLIGIENIYGSMHNDQLTGDHVGNVIMGNKGSDFIDGGRGDDTLMGGMDADEIMGGSGDDMLYGGKGDDELSGGMGDDVITGGMGADEIDGGEGMDVVRYASSAEGVTIDLGGMGSGGDAEGDSFMNIEKVIGSMHDDKLTVSDAGGTALGYAGDDMLFGGKGDATLGGGKGDDMLDAGAGNNSLTGGMGDDTFILWTGVGDVTNKLTDFAAGDMIKFGAVADGVTKKLSSEDVDMILDGGKHTDAGYQYEHQGVTFITPIMLTESSFYADSAPSGGGSMNSVILDNTPNVWPGAGQVNSGDDHIRAKGGDDEIYAGMGDDIIDAGADDDMAYGGSGDDTLYGGTGNDMLYGDALDDEGPVEEADVEPGNDVIRGGAGDDTISGNEGHDRLYGEAGDDTINGNDGRDRLEGGDKDDVLYGGAGRDLLDGGAGNDTMHGGEGNDEIHATKGDVVDGDGLPSSDADPGADETTAEGDDDTVSYAGTDEGVTVALDVDTAPTTGHENVINVENFIGSEKNDDVDGGTSANVIEGRGGDDTLDGGDENDTLMGGAGKDNLTGDTGDDMLDGGSGNDMLDGGTGADTLTGGSGSDTFTWGDGDTITDYHSSDKIDLGEEDSGDYEVIANREGDDVTVTLNAVGTTGALDGQSMTFEDLTVAQVEAGYIDFGG
jgi:Ca2+-binding RTX toxin-like protein